MNWIECGRRLSCLKPSIWAIFIEQRRKTVKNSDTVFGVEASSKKGGDTRLPSVWEDRPANETGFPEVKVGSTNWLSVRFKEGHCVSILVMNLRVSEQET
jgi:hypothetical protein